MKSTTKNTMAGSAKVQGELWGKRAKDWAEIQEPKAAPLFDSILSNIKYTGSKFNLLDIGCGSGVFCKMAFDKGIDVTGFDASRSMLEEARKLLPDNNFYEGDMEHLPFEDESFDIVTGITAFQFADNPSNALKEANRVLKKGGQFFMAIWGPPEKCEVGIILSVMKDLVPPPTKPPAPPSALYEAGKLEKFVGENGFKPIRRVDVPYAWEYENSEMILKAFLSVGPVELAIGHSGEEKVRDAMLGAMQSLKKEDGSFTITNTFTYVIATK